MRDGKKSVAESIFSTALSISSKKRQRSEPLKVFEQALDNVTAHD
jgi:ribosomal protein S7